MVLLHAYGLHTRPGQERLPESRVRNPCGHRINSLNSELDSSKGGRQVMLTCLRPGEQPTCSPGKRRIADLSGDAQGLVAICLGLGPLPGGENPGPGRQQYQLQAVGELSVRRHTARKT